MKKILITGLTGFVGSWVSLILFYNNYKVYGVSLKNNNPLHIYNKAKEDGLDFRKGLNKINFIEDINDADFILGCTPFFEKADGLISFASS